jgi:hypothetical protein
LSDGVRTISADEFQGRYPGTEGERLTLAWLQGQYEAMGLQPGGPDGQWLQRVELKRYAPEGVAVVSWTGPDGQVHALEPGKDILVRAATNDGRASVQGAPVAFAGYGIDAPERNWNDWGDLDVRGKIVIVMPGEPDGEVFNGQYTTHHASAAAKADQAFRRGAVGVIMMNPVASTDPAWARAVQQNGRTRGYTPGAANLEFSGSLNMDTAHAMVTAAGLDHARFGGYASGSFKAMDLTGVTMSVQTSETMKEGEARDARLPLRAFWPRSGHVLRADGDRRGRGQSVHPGARRRAPRTRQWTQTAARARERPARCGKSRARGSARPQSRFRQEPLVRFRAWVDTAHGDRNTYRSEEGRGLAPPQGERSR